MLNVAAVCVGDAFAPEYVEILYSMVRRNLAGGTRGRFTVFTDRPAVFESMAGVETKVVPSWLTGWWAKLALFQPGAFPKGERVLYFDLDTVITGPLDKIAAYPGAFALLEDAYRKGGFQSAIMGWIAGTPLADSIWEEFAARTQSSEDAAALWPGGDQNYLEMFWREYLPKRIKGDPWPPDFWQSLYPGLMRSYKQENCVDFVPKGTSVVYFHGFPRPHQAAGWVREVWKITDETIFFALNVKEEEVRKNVRFALALHGARWIEKGDPTHQAAIIVGGGPSLADYLWKVKGHQLSGGVVYATNNTANFLLENGITPDAHVMHDARKANLNFVPNLQGKPFYYASQCHPAVLACAGDRLVLWHPHTETILDEIGDDPRGSVMVSGGPTVGLNAISLCYILGHRRFELFGFDSCYRLIGEPSHHAYPQALNEGELVLDVTADGVPYRCAPWMVQQAEKFLPLYEQLLALGCEVWVHGEGMIQALVANHKQLFHPADERAEAILTRLADIEKPKGAEIGVFAGDLSKRLLMRAGLELLMVDSWKQSPPGSSYGESDFHGKLTQKQHDEFCQLAQIVTRFAGERAQVIRKPSLEAAREVPDASLDFVFIDADHSYEAVRADILAWAPKVRSGGWICGHDFREPRWPQWGVEKAVLELLGEPELGKNFTWFKRVA